MSDSKSTVPSFNDDGRSLRDRRSKDLQLREMAKRTHDGYLREVRKSACHYKTASDLLSKQQVGDYLLISWTITTLLPGR